MSNQTPFDINRMAEQVLKLVDELSEKHPMQSASSLAKENEALTIERNALVSERDKWKRRAETAELAAAKGSARELELEQSLSIIARVVREAGK